MAFQTRRTLELLMNTSRLLRVVLCRNKLLWLIHSNLFLSNKLPLKIKKCKQNATAVRAQSHFNFTYCRGSLQVSGLRTSFN